MGCSQSYWRYGPCALLLRRRSFPTLHWHTGSITCCDLSSGKGRLIERCVSVAFLSLQGRSRRHFPPLCVSMALWRSTRWSETRCSVQCKIKHCLQQTHAC